MDGRGIALLIVAGVLIGGTYSLYQQKFPKPVTILMGLLAALSLVGAILWSI